MNPEQFYSRISEVVDPAFLRTKRVAVVGLGSGGSRVAAELGRLGIQLLLLERPRERLEEHNIVRHLLGYRSLGKSKLREVKHFVQNFNPSTPISARALDVVAHQEKLENLLRSWRPDLLAVCTDNEPSKHAINQVAIRLGIPQAGGAVYDGGMGGEVYRIRPGGPCYGCIAAHLKLERQAPKPVSRDYRGSQSGAPPSLCALNLDILQIALLQCRLALDFLSGQKHRVLGLPPEVNLCVFANRVVPGVFARPWHCEFFNIDKRADCLHCGEIPNGVQEKAAGILSALGRPVA